VGLVRYRQKAKVVLELPRGFGEVGRGRAIMEGAAAAEVDPEFVAMMIELELVTKEQAIEWGWLKGDNVLTTDTERCKGEKG
jgi:hypothetical protein